MLLTKVWASIIMCMYLAEMMSLIEYCMYHLFLPQPTNRSMGKRKAPGHIWLRWCRLSCGNCPAPLQCPHTGPHDRAVKHALLSIQMPFFPPEKATGDPHTYKVISHCCSQVRECTALTQHNLFFSFHFQVLLSSVKGKT